MKSKFLGLLAVSAVLALAPLSAHAAPETYAFDTAHTSVIWKAGHMGFSFPHGIFSNIEGTLVLDEADISKSAVDVTIPLDKIATGIPKFDDHLKSKDFFNVEKTPTAKFVSTKVEKTGDKTAKLTGDLTLNGITKPVTLDVTLNKQGEHPMMKKKAVGFSATAQIKRSDFGITYGIPNVPDEVDLEIQAEAQVK
jgi:polyisoprenoid-binding protein YceI